MQAILGGLKWRRSSLFLVDHALIVSAVLIAVVIRLGVPTDGPYFWSLLWRAIIAALVLQVCLHYCDFYDLHILHSRRDLFIGLIRAMGAAAIVLAVLYFWVPVLVIGRGIFLFAATLVIVLLTGWRMIFEWLTARVGPTERLLIVGRSSAAVALAKEIATRRYDLGVELVGFVDVETTKHTEADDLPQMVGTVFDIPRIARERSVDRVVVSLADARGKLSMDSLLHMKLKEGVRFDHLASVYEEYTGKIAVENLRPSYLVFSDGFRQTRSMNAIKRALDVVTSLVALAVLWPIMLLVAILVRATSPGPAIYRQRRVGRNGREFTVLKFRSMRADAESATGAVWAQQRDPRITVVGRLLRRTRLDELPQFWNILRGDMSFVGPRPERPEFVDRLTQVIPFYGQRHVVRPGLTGWAQVRHKYGASIEDSIEKLQFDLYYIKHMSIAFDLFIVVATLKTILMREGS